MSQALLQVQDLTVELAAGDRTLRPVDHVSLELGRQETFALLGESGCGKSMTALALMRLLPETGRIIAGSVRLGEAELLALPEARMRDARGRRMAMIFQEPATALNPVMTVGSQLAETLARHRGLQGEAIRQQAIAGLEAVGIPDPGRHLGQYPFQLSGGMKQRTLIAMALAAEPELLIADEPTTALDVTIQAQVLRLLDDLKRRTGMGILLITHDLAVAAEYAQRVAVMYAGELVETASREAFFQGPAHPYSRQLFAALPSQAKRGQPLAVIPGTVPDLAAAFAGCRFADRCGQVLPRCHREIPSWAEVAPGHRVRCLLYAETIARAFLAADGRPAAASPPAAPESGAAAAPLLRVADLKVHFPIRKGLLRQTAGHVKAVDGVSLEIAAGRTLALVGESGCGKTTVGKALLRLIPPTSGRVEFAGEDLSVLSSRALRQRRRHLQIVFQDPYSSLNPRMRVADIIEEGMTALGVAAEPSRRIAALLEEVGLSPDMVRRYPHEFSGGQRQRIAIARALAVSPRLIVCDEPTSALDVSVQAQILNLLRRLQADHGLAYLLITHNLAVVEFLAHRVAVMYLGRIVEQGSVEAVLGRPRHPYTRALLSAVPTLHPRTGREVIWLKGEMPSPAAPPPGCHFHPRCPEALPECRSHYPKARLFDDGHYAHCHLYPEHPGS